jgi:hypothetical protein
VHNHWLLVRALSRGPLARALPRGHPAAGLARAAADEHLARVATLEPAAGFNRSHWIPTFLLYLDERLRAGQSANASGGGQAHIRFRSP